MYNIHELCNILELHKLDIMFMNGIIFMNITQFMNIIPYIHRIDKDRVCASCTEDKYHGLIDLHQKQ